MTLAQLMRHFFALYGPRNRVFLDSWVQRTAFLGVAVTDLSRGLRRGIDHDLQIVGTVRIVSRVFCVAEHFGEHLPFLEVLCSKYSSVCSYCAHSPCVCKATRSDAQLATMISIAQFNWSLAEWSKHFAQLYGTANSKFSTEQLLLRLEEEATEVLTLAMSAPSSSDSASIILRKIADELADTFGWINAIANALGIDLEQGLLDRYYPDCWKCHRNPCECGPFDHHQVNWAELAQG
ncbi:MAG: hypothetical protein WC400_02120 [Patescibacteria group bacterium]